MSTAAVPLASSHPANVPDPLRGSSPPYRRAPDAEGVPAISPMTDRPAAPAFPFVDPVGVPAPPRGFPPTAPGPASSGPADRDNVAAEPRPLASDRHWRCKQTTPACGVE